MKCSRIVFAVNWKFSVQFRQFFFFFFLPPTTKKKTKQNKTQHNKTNNNQKTWTRESYDVLISKLLLYPAVHSLKDNDPA